MTAASWKFAKIYEQKENADTALAWKGGYTREFLCDLIQHLHDLHDAYQAKVWELVKTWAANASDADKAIVREKIRVTVMSRRALKRTKGGRFRSALDSGQSRVSGARTS